MVYSTGSDSMHSENVHTMQNMSIFSMHGTPVLGWTEFEVAYNPSSSEIFRVVW